MVNHMKFYIDGAWVNPIGEKDPRSVVNPATEEANVMKIALGSKDDVDQAVAARPWVAFPIFSRTGKDEARSTALRVIRRCLQEAH